ncbi:MAG: phosphoribosylformylglycinamidine cyclo-ligase, partial [Thermodesulfobacteriota bacterium]
MKNKALTYRDSGVDIREGQRLVKRITPALKKTMRKEVQGGPGGFGALFSAGFKGMKDPVLVSSTDGVGTKLIVAFMAGVDSTVGIDLVAMNVNDILTAGAEPLFFLDYFATGSLKGAQAARVIKGIAAGCAEAGCALIGGETAEMPGIYKAGEYDLAGFAVGVVERKKIIDGRSIKAGDAIIGLHSSGLHSNGFSLARKVLFDRLGLDIKKRVKGLRGRSLGSALLEPTRIYVKPVLKVCKKFTIKGMAHITGGGFLENIPRTLPQGLKAIIERGSWPVPPIFSLIQSGGDVGEMEMLRTFNCGIGLVIIA